MSMIGNFLRVSPATLDELRADPERITEVLYPDDDAARNEAAQLDIDKAWHGIHFLLTGSTWEGESPLNFIVCGEPIGEVDVGYGPARGFSADEVRTIAAALQPITAHTLRSRYDARELAKRDIYPTIWQREADEACDYLVEYFEQLKVFVRDAAEAREALIVYIN